MKKILFFSAVLMNILWMSCQNNSSQPSWTPPALPIHEGIGQVTDRIGGLGCEALVIAVKKDTFVIQFVKDLAAEMDRTAIGEYVRFKGSDNETFAFERLTDKPEKELQQAVFFRKVN